MNSDTSVTAIEDTGKERDELLMLVRAHETWRQTTLNLIASENVHSGAVDSVIATDLVGRYADYPGRDLTVRRYRGNRYIVQIEKQAARLAREVFHADYVELRPTAGHLAGVAVIMGLCRPGDLVLEIGVTGGGHREGERLAMAPLADLRVQFLPFDWRRFNVDVPAAVKLIEDSQPALVILGSSNFLFPHPVRELADAVHKLPGSHLAYDGSHVMGLLAGGQFQDPLGEGADIVFGSTHKTLPGPQGGIIYSNRDDLMEAITPALVPALVTNHEAFRIPPLAMALAEMKFWGRAYADAIVRNSQALGQALAQQGVSLVEVDGVPTASHTLLLRVAEFGTGAEVAARLEEANIITTSATLPAELGREGLRIGTQELTHRGATPDEMTIAARLISDALREVRPADTIAEDVGRLTATLQDVQFTWR